MNVTLKLSRLSMDMTEATIGKWHKQVGDTVVVGDALYDIETEKVTNEIASPTAGILTEVLAPTGAELEVGAPVCRIEVSSLKGAGDGQ